MIKAQLINLGRESVNKTVTVKTEKELHREIQKHILSKNWDMVAAGDDVDVWNISSGFRNVGQVKILEQTK